VILTQSQRSVSGTEAEEGEKYIISMFVALLREPGISGIEGLEGNFLINGCNKKSRISRISALTRQNAKVLC
jgi:hypothetical protein